MRIVVSGASGLIGRAFTNAATAAGHDVVPLVRRAAGPGAATWDPATGLLDPSVLDGAHAVVNLCGAGIADRRWSRARRDLLVASRVEPTRLLAETIAARRAPLPVLVNASAVGWYGERGDETLDETSSPGTGFLAELCGRWDAATAAAEDAGARVVHVRSGVVLARHGGALARQLPLFRAGLGGRLGSGRQWMSWISIGDEVGVLLRVVEDSSFRGAVNATAPEPVTNRDYTRHLARQLHRPARFVVPRPALALVFGRRAVDEFLLVSQRVLPARLADAGYPFRHPTLPEALAAVLSA